MQLQMSFSPDGQFLISGDSGGRAFIWEWKTCRIQKTLKMHDKVRALRHIFRYRF
jgi:pre-mRNA-processing factor 17